MVALAGATLIFSCESDMLTVVKLSAKDSIPDITVHNIRVKQSEMGQITLELTAPKMISFQNRDAFTEFPNGICIIFYDSVMEPKTRLTASYGISWDNRRTMEAKGNVVIYNFKKREQLNTEYLFYDRNARKVSSNEFVKITTPEKIVLGKGMESDEHFDNWSIRNVRATIYVNESK
jgi:LPS export ABC transporter protein LptC